MFLPAGNTGFMSIIEAIFNDAKGSLRAGRPQTTGALLKLDMLWRNMIHRAGSLSYDKQCFAAWKRAVGVPNSGAYSERYIKSTLAKIVIHTSSSSLSLTLNIGAANFLISYGAI